MKRYLQSIFQPSGQTIYVDYATADGTAAAGSDHNGVSSTITFLPGETTKYIAVLVIGDYLSENNVHFTANISNSVNSSISDSTGVCTIVDNDAGNN